MQLEHSYLCHVATVVAFTSIAKSEVQCKVIVATHDDTCRRDKGDVELV